MSLAFGDMGDHRPRPSVSVLQAMRVNWAGCPRACTELVEMSRFWNRGNHKPSPKLNAENKLPFVHTGGRRWAEKGRDAVPPQPSSGPYYHLINTTTRPPIF